MKIERTLRAGRNRWYDVIPFMADAVEMASALPVDVQMLIAHHLNSKIQQINHITGAGELKSLGVNRVLGLYNAGNRNRWYDGQSSLRRSLNMMATLPDEDLTHFAARVLHVGSVVQKELSQQKHAHPTSPRERVSAPRTGIKVMMEVERILSGPETPLLIQRASELQLHREGKTPAPQPETQGFPFIPTRITWDQEQPKLKRQWRPSGR